MLEIAVDEIVFEGLSPAEARRAARAFESHLAALIAQRGLPEGVRLRDIEVVDLADLPVSARLPEPLGRALAEALLDGLSP